MKRKKKIGRLILLTAVLAAILIQFVPVDRDVPETDPNNDFLVMHDDIPEDVAEIMKKACYDCHSYKTRHPWYSYVAPVSWWLGNHIEHARENINLSIWGTYSVSDHQKMYEEMAEEVEEGSMPLNSYTWLHKDARLTEEERGRFVLYMHALE
jgi:hypothetical protein